MTTIFKPKRKRAFHRALKRGEPWAVWQQLIIDNMNLINRALYADMVYNASPLLRLAGLKESLDE